MPLMRHPTTGRLLLAPSGLLAGSAACCCDGDGCCDSCPWLEDYFNASGKFKATFIEGPITGYIVLAVTSAASPNSCIEWSTEDDTNVVDCDDLWGGAQAIFWCERTGSSNAPLKFSMTMGNGGCEAITTTDPEFAECTSPPPGEAYGTLTVRYRYTMGELFPGGCDGACGGVPQDIVVEITRHP